jgi:hypothetical protein
MTRFGRSTCFAARVPVAALQPVETDLDSIRLSTAFAGGAFGANRSGSVDDTMVEQTRTGS